MQRRLVLPASAFALLLVHASSFAAGPSGPDKALPIVQSGFAWPAGLGTGNFGRAEVGQITEDMVLDVVELRGPAQPVGAVDDLAALIYGPANHRGVIPLPLLVADFAIVRGAGPFGRDAIALLGKYGVSLATVKDGSNQFSITKVAMPEFSGALRLRSADYDQDGDSDLLGLRGDGRALLVAESSRGAFVVHSLLLPPGLTATDFVFVDAGKPNVIEFALLDPYGLIFVATDSSMLGLAITKAYRTEKAHGSIATFRALENAPQRVAWVTGAVGSPKQLLLVADSGKLDPTAVGFPAEGIMALSCADLDRDGDEDAVLTRTALAGTLALFSQASLGSQIFSNDSQTHRSLLPAGVPALPEPKQQAWPALGDLDHDGDCEVLVACESSGIVGLIEGETFAKPTKGLNDPPPPPSAVSGEYANDPAGGFDPKCRADLRVNYAVPDGLASDFRLNVVVWRQPAYQAPVEPDAIAFALLPIPTGTPGDPKIQFKLDVAESGAFPFSAIFWIESRFVRIDPVDGRILESFPASVYGFAAALMSTPGSAPIGPSITPLVAEPDSGPMIPVIFEFPTAGAVQCGGLVPKASVPYFPPGPAIPRPHGSSSGGPGPGG